MENISTFKEKLIILENPSVINLIEKLELEPTISNERIFKSKINARVNIWMNEIINPHYENKITRK